MIYFFYLFLLLLLLFIERLYKKTSRFCRILIPILYCLLIGLRGRQVGKDTETYYTHFYEYGQWGCNFVEPGFDLINKYIYHLGGDANCFFLTLAAISLFFIYLSLDELKGNRYSITAFFLYFFTFNFFTNGMRQAVALSIFMYAYKYIVSRNFLNYIVLLLGASLFHSSSLLLIPLYFLTYINVTKFQVIIFYLLSFLGVFIDISFFIPNLSFLSDSYSRYTDSLRIADASWLGFTVLKIQQIIILLMMIKNELFQRYGVLSSLILIGFALSNLGYSLPIIGRITIYFSYFVYFVFPCIFASKSRYLFNNRIFVISIMTILILATWINSLVDYTPFWEDRALYVNPNSFFI